MRYDYQCPDCKKIEEQIHGMSENPEYKCSVCGTVMIKVFAPTRFIMRGGTEAIHYREKRNHLKKNEILKEKQKRHKGPRIQPNVAGMEVDSWKDAQKLAKEAGLNAESYTPFIEKENNEKKGKILV